MLGAEDRNIREADLAATPTHRGTGLCSASRIGIDPTAHTIDKVVKRWMTFCGADDSKDQARQMTLVVCHANS